MKVYPTRVEQRRVNRQMEKYGCYQGPPCYQNDERADHTEQYLKPSSNSVCARCYVRYTDDQRAGNDRTQLVAASYGTVQQLGSDRGAEPKYCSRHKSESDDHNLFGLL